MWHTANTWSSHQPGVSTARMGFQWRCEQCWSKSYRITTKNLIGLFRCSTGRFREHGGRLVEESRGLFVLSCCRAYKSMNFRLSIVRHVGLASEYAFWPRWLFFEQFEPEPVFQVSAQSAICCTWSGETTGPVTWRPWNITTQAQTNGPFYPPAWVLAGVTQVMHGRTDISISMWLDPCEFPKRGNFR